MHGWTILWNGRGAAARRFHIRLQDGNGIAELRLRRVRLRLQGMRFGLLGQDLGLRGSGDSCQRPSAKRDRTESLIAAFPPTGNGSE